MRNNRFISTTLKNSLQVIVRFIIGILNIKIIALFVGPTGMATVGQLQNFLQFGVSIGSTGINDGVIKFIAQNNHSRTKQGLYISTSITIVSVAALVVGLIVLLLAPFLSETIFKSQQYILLTRFSGIYIITTSLFNLIASIINGLRFLKTFIFLNIFLSVSGFIIAFVSVYFHGLEGLLWGIIFQTSLAFLVGSGILIKTFKSNPFSFSKLVVKKLSKYSLMVIVSSALLPLSTIIIRDIIITHLSLTDAGIWDGITKLSNNYILLVTMSFGYYFLPTFASMDSQSEIKKEIISVYKILIPILLIGGLIIYFMRLPIIKILFSEEFYKMADILKWQLIGDFFKILSWVIGILIISKEKVYLFITTEIISVLIQIGLAYWLIKWIGFEGSTLFYGIENLIYFSVMTGIFWFYWYRTRKTQN